MTLSSCKNNSRPIINLTSQDGEITKKHLPLPHPVPRGLFCWLLRYVLDQVPGLAVEGRAELVQYLPGNSFCSLVV